MAYVDLKPVRACIAKTPEDSNFASFKERVTPRFDASRAIADQIELGQTLHDQISIKPLLPFKFTDSDAAKVGLNCIPFGKTDYLQLVDWTGQVESLESDKRGKISSSIAPIFVRLETPPGDWLARELMFEKVRPLYSTRRIS